MVRSLLLAALAAFALLQTARADDVEAVAAVLPSCAPDAWHSFGAQSRSTRWTFADGSTIDATLSRRRCADGTIGLLLEYRSIGHVDLPCGPFELVQGDRRVRVRPVDAWGREHLAGHCPQLPGQPSESVAYGLAQSVTPPASAGIDIEAPLSLRYGGLVPGEHEPLRLPRTLPLQTPGSLTGFWTDPGRNGEGWAFELADIGGREVLYTSWLHHDQGRAKWLVGFVDLDAFGSSGDARLRVPLFETSGASFGAAFDPASVVRTAWGDVSLAFDGCDAISAEWRRSDGRRGAQRLVRLGRQLAGTRCFEGKRNGPTDSAVAQRLPAHLLEATAPGLGLAAPDACTGAIPTTPATRAFVYAIEHPDARVTLTAWRCAANDVRITREVLDARVPVGFSYVVVQDGIRLPSVQFYRSNRAGGFPNQGADFRDDTLAAQAYRIQARDSFSFPGKYLDPSREFTLELRIGGIVYEAAIPAYTPGDEAPVGRGYAFTGTQSGLWQVAGRDGEAYFVEVGANADGKFVFVAWLTYEAGRPLWLAGSTPVAAGMLADRATLTLYRAEGAQFGDAFRVADVRLAPWGTLELESLACDTMRFRHRSAAGDGEHTAHRYFERLVGNACRP